MSTLLEIRGVERRFGGVRALDGVSFDVADGDVLGLVGPNGSGKSTLINIISGLLPASSGQVRMEGEDLTGLQPHQIVARGIARTYQRPRPFAELTVEGNVMMGAAFRADLGGLDDARREARRCIESVGLGGYVDEPVSQLNLHQLKFLELARALATQPRVLLLDEVLSGLNPTEIDESAEMLERIAAAGTTLVIVEHIMRVVVKLCQRVVVLDDGRLIAEGAPGDVMDDPEVRRAYLGTKGV